MKIKTMLLSLLVILMVVLLAAGIIKLENQISQIENKGLEEKIVLLEKEIDYLKKQSANNQISEPKIEKNTNAIESANWNDSTSWKEFKNQELGFSFKYPAELGEINFKINNAKEGANSGLHSGKEFKGNFMVKKSGKTEDAYFRMGGVTKDFSKGSEGGFDVFAGYYLEDGKYYHIPLDQFIDRKDEIIPTKILQINGKEMLLSERTVVYGDTFHEKGVYINLLGNSDFKGLAIENLSLTSEQFKKILATFQFNE